MTRVGRLVLGTSGFSYAHWRDVFYPRGTPQSQWLESYAERFSSVELNVTFYRLPQRETFADWARRTPDDFTFVVKGSRLITHYHRLRDVREAVDALMMACEGLGGKLTCMLWQLPPRSEPHPDVLDEFCTLVAERGAAQLPGIEVRHAFEFRDERWFADESLSILRSHGCALVLADPGRAGQPTNVLTTDFTYLRFHHGPRDSGAYEDEELRPWAERARGWLEDGVDVLAYFNNDPGGWAPRNAASFRELVGAKATV